MGEQRKSIGDKWLSVATSALSQSSLLCPEKATRTSPPALKGLITIYVPRSNHTQTEDEVDAKGTAGNDSRWLRYRCRGLHLIINPTYMVTTAGDFLAHTAAGLQLTKIGKELGWMGSEAQWGSYEIFSKHLN